MIKTILEINQTTKVPKIKVKGKGVKRFSQYRNLNFLVSLKLMDHILQLVLKFSKVLQNWN